MNGKSTIGSAAIATAILATMLVGAFGPWVSVFGITINGTDGGRDGWIVVGAAVVAAIFLGAYARLGRRWLLAFPLLAGLLSAATAAYDAIEPAGSSSDLLLGDELVQTEWGIYVALAGSILLVAYSLALIVRAKSTNPSRQGSVVSESMQIDA